MTINPFRPPAQSGYAVYSWDAGISEPVICWLEYEEADAGGPYEPPQSEYVCVAHAWVGQIDLAPMLTDEQLEQIEVGFVHQLRREREDAKIDAWEASHE